MSLRRPDLRVGVTSEKKKVPWSSRLGRRSCRVSSLPGRPPAGDGSGSAQRGGDVLEQFVVVEVIESGRQIGSHDPRDLSR